MHSGSIQMKYRHQVRIGNWSEEWELEKIRFRDYMSKQQRTSISHSKIEAGHVRASLTYSRDGRLHIGDKVMLFNDKTCGYLVSDTWEKTNGIDEQYPLSTTQKTFPCARSIFVIASGEAREPQSSEICYGQKIRLCVNPLLFPKKLYLSSQLTDVQRSKKSSGNLNSFLGNRDNGDSLWVIEHLDPSIRFEMNMHPVDANAGVILRHFQTNQYLASDDTKVTNTYGVENEVIVHTYTTHNKTQNLIAEKSGRTTIDIPMRNQHSQNTWVIVTADDPVLEFDDSSTGGLTTQAKKPTHVLTSIRQEAISKGIISVRTLATLLADMDEAKNGQLDYDNFRWGLRNFGTPLNNPEEAFDENHDGHVAYEAFLTAIKVPFSKTRADLVNSVYARLKVAQGTAVVTLEAIGKGYKAHAAPQVKRGVKSAKQHFDEYIAEWKQLLNNNLLAAVSQQDFLAYYEDVSALYEKDEQFEALLAATW